jgi:hypothetical protein
VLAKNPDYWRCYNIRIYDYLEKQVDSTGNRFPYTISYLQNKHQNDEQNPYYSQFGAQRKKNLFVTVNPPSIHRDKVMESIVRRIDGSEAYQTYRHNIMDMRAYLNKPLIEANQGYLNAYYIGGFASYGVGLHEDLLCLAKSVAEKILSDTIGFETKDREVEIVLESKTATLRPEPVEEVVQVEAITTPDLESVEEENAPVFSFKLNFD